MSDQVHIFAGGNIDRLSEKRGDAAWLDALSRRDDARLVLFAPDLSVLVRRTGENSVAALAMPLAEAPNGGLAQAEAPLLLGLVENGAPLYGQILRETAPEAGGVEAIDLRSLALQGLMPPRDLARVGYAKQLFEWHANHGFCGKCGARSDIRDGGLKRVCPHCKREHFPRVDPVVIMLPVYGDKCLMGRSRNFMPGLYSALAGFLEPGESIEEAVRRETLEESGIVVGAVRYHSSQPWPFPSSLMIGCLAEASSERIDFDRDELEDCRWFTRADARAMLARQHPDQLYAPYPLAIAHHLIKTFAEA